MLKKPQALTPNSKITIVSLSSGILGESFADHQLQLGIKRLKEMELVPMLMPNALKGLTYLAHHPQARADDLKTAFADPEIKGIVCAIGGDDTYRLLPYLLEDETFIHNVQVSPKLFTGFSDTTINHLMFYQLGMQSFYGPNFLNDLAELDQEMLPYTKHTFMNYFRNEATTSIKSSPVWYEEREDFSPAAVGTKRVQHVEQKGYEVLRGSGRVTGRLLGGCLDSLYDILSGTRYPDEKDVAEKYHLFPSLDEWQDKILFIETSEEKPAPELYQKMLLALDAKGIFSAISALIVGKPQAEAFYDEYNRMLLAVTKKYNLPILTNVNFGHAYPRTALPYGGKMQIDFDRKSLTLTEPIFAQEETLNR